MSNNYHNDTQQINTDQAWDNLYARLQKEDLIADPAKEHRLLKSQLFKWAAAAVLALCLTTMLMSGTEKPAFFNIA